jgi:hypothetical protein
MEFELKGLVKLRIKPKKDKTGFSLQETKIRLEVSENLDIQQYITEKGNYNKDGTKALTNAFVQGLSANIHQAHQNGIMDSAEHLRFVISELERFFVENVNVNIEEW